MSAANTMLPPPDISEPEWPETGPAQRDTLTTMLFVAALFHGIVILGITFSAEQSPFRSATATSLEVVLLNRTYEKRPDTEDAQYLAQQNLEGAGNTENDESVRVAYGNDPARIAADPDATGNAQSVESDQHDTQRQTLYVDRASASAPATAAALQPRNGALPGQTNTVEIVAAPDLETRLSSAGPRQLLISANTRESRIAAYLDSWKRRVERVGTLNFPRSALATGGSRNPVLEVSIAADGSLQQVRVIDGSGNRELDMAAVTILRLAAPFDPFPEYLRNDYDELAFSYEWQFNAGSISRITVP